MILWKCLNVNDISEKRKKRQIEFTHCNQCRWMCRWPHRPAIAARVCFWHASVSSWRCLWCAKDSRCVRFVLRCLLLEDVRVVNGGGELLSSSVNGQGRSVRKGLNRQSHPTAVAVVATGRSGTLSRRWRRTRAAGAWQAPLHRPRLSRPHGIARRYALTSLTRETLSVWPIYGDTSDSKRGTVIITLGITQLSHQNKLNKFS